MLVLVGRPVHAGPCAAQELHDPNINQHSCCPKHHCLCQQVHNSTAKDRVREGVSGAVGQAWDGDGSCRAATQQHHTTHTHTRFRSAALLKPTLHAAGGVATKQLVC